MLLGNLLKSINKKYKKIPVNGVCFDSRKIKKGDIFFAILGNKLSGYKFINSAIIKGASVIIVDKKNKEQDVSVPIVKVKDVQKSLAEACANYYKKKPKYISAVTGTNGKSSVANFFYQILSLNKISAASIGTLGVLSKKYSKKTILTTEDPVSLHENLQKLKENKIDHVILEASSHGLAQKRLDNLKISMGIFTNLSHDHLDYHKNIKSYFNSKIYLFNNLLIKNSKIITDEQSKVFKKIKKISIKKNFKRYTIGTSSGTIRILNNTYKENKQYVKILVNSKKYLLEIPLIGYFQIKNLLMAVLAASLTGLSFGKIFSKIHKIKAVPGRLECVAKLNNNSIILLDFAHTPEALVESLVSLKKQFNKKITLVFGCGGERDKKKRFIMGQVAKKYCDKIYVTDDNPRNENPKKIRNSIIKGCGKLATNIANREKAIKNAILKLNQNEVLLVAGKGHEVTQDYGKKVINFSDKKIIKKILNEDILKKMSYQKLLISKVFNKNEQPFNYSGVSINTKTIKKNNLFFAIRGKKMDGHDFIKEAIKKGAIKAVISKKINKNNKNKIINVKNTFFSLNKLAELSRSISSAKIIGITGSVGKTTLKNLISFSLKKYGKVYHSPHSYNNKFGVPLSLSNLKKDTEFGIFEIGMNKEGEINKLSKIVRPDIAIITNISEAHLKYFKTIKDIARTKAEIINNISTNGNIVLNRDDKFFNFLSNLARKQRINITSFGLTKKADIFLVNIQKIKNTYRLKISIKNNFFYFTTKNVTNNFLNNILACITVLSILNLDLKNIKSLFSNFYVPSGRGDITFIKKFNKKFKFIDESYNANPLSMTSALNNLKHYKKVSNAQKIVFLGDMLELGKSSKKLHRNLSTVINQSDIDKVFVYGKHIKETFNYLTESKKGIAFNNLKDAYRHFSKILHNSDLLMVKGSNATGLNQFSKKFKKGNMNVI